MISFALPSHQDLEAFFLFCFVLLKTCSGSSFFYLHFLLAKVGGDIEVGSIVKVPLNVVNTTKVDSKNLTLVDVERRQ